MNTNTQYYYEKANIHCERGQLSRAIEDYNNAIRLNPMLAMSYYNRGNLKFKLKDFYGTIEDCTQAINLNPEYAKAYINRAIAKESLGNYQSALKDLEKARKLLETSNNLALLQIAEQAITELKKFI